MNESIFFHIENPGFLPIGAKFDQIQNIDSYTEGGLSGIIIHDLLDYYAEADGKVLLSHIKTKLADGGSLSLQGVDLKQLSIAIAFNEINIQLAQNILYPNKKSIMTMYEAERVLNDLGLQIIVKKYINIFEYYILAKKI